MKFDSFSDDDSHDLSYVSSSFEEQKSSKYTGSSSQRNGSRHVGSSLASRGSTNENRIQEEKKSEHDLFHKRIINQEESNGTNYDISILNDSSSHVVVGQELWNNRSTNTADTSNKKKKKKKKKKKARKNNTQTLATTKKVTFTNVQVSEFCRDIHGNGVPSDGGWPLALSNQFCRSYQIDVDDFERNKQLELRKRYEQYVLARRRGHKKKVETKSSRRKRSNSKVGGEQDIIKECQVDSHVEVYIPDDFEFETRQFDYKQRSSDQHHQEGSDGTLEWEEIHSAGKNVLFKQLGESERKELLLRDVHLQKHGKEDHGRAPKSTSSSRKDSITEDDVFCALDLQQVRHELEQIRIHRATESAAGCSCRKLHVVLLDELNEGHKKKSHHHRRLTERKVKEELRKRHVNIPKDASREDLEKLLHDEVEKHGCCYGNDCPCVSSGIGCQSDTCSCWHMSHVLGSHKKHGERGEFADPVEAQQRCGNKNGMYAVDFGAIRRHRDKFIVARDANMCSVISG